MFYVVFDLLEEKQLYYSLDSEGKITVLDKVVEILLEILKNGESKNFSVK